MMRVGVVVADVVADVVGVLMWHCAKLVSPKDVYAAERAAAEREQEANSSVKNRLLLS